MAAIASKIASAAAAIFGKLVGSTPPEAEDDGMRVLCRLTWAITQDVSEARILLADALPSDACSSSNDASTDGSEEERPLLPREWQARVFPVDARSPTFLLLRPGAPPCLAEARRLRNGCTVRELLTAIHETSDEDPDDAYFEGLYAVDGAAPDGTPVVRVSTGS